MSQAGIKNLISRLGIDESFREDFMKDPKLTIAANSIDITPEEADTIISNMEKSGAEELSERKNPFWWLGWFG